VVDDSHTARAARLLKPGQPLRVEPVQLPQPAEDEVLVTLQFGGVNPIDRYIALGRVNPDGALPRTLGGEAAGILDGRPVLVSGDGLGAVRDGLWAQAAVVPRSAVYDLPAGLAPREAAAMGIAGLTALNCVRHVAAVTAADRVLVLGASGGVGSMIVSLARAAGATVWGQTGSAEKVAGIVQDGAHRVVVGGPEKIAAEITEWRPTVAFDPLGDGFVAALVQAIAPRGRIVSFGVSAGAEVTFNVQLLYRKGVSLLGYAGGLVPGEQRRAGLGEVFEAVRAGELTVRIDEVLPLDQVNVAFQRLVDRQVRGKLLLDLR
jgi:NADPH2:quinone reductase